MPHNPNKREQFAALYKAGESFPDMAERLCVAEGTLRSWRLQMPLPRRSSAPARTGSLPDSEADAYIREHYGKGKLSAAMIGKRLGVTKNAVIGRARRLGVANRKKPKWGDHGLGHLTPAPKTCSWPVGDPAKPGFRYCGGLSLTGKPYCREHMDRAYTRYNGQADAQAAVERQIGGALRAIERETRGLVT